MRDANFLLAGGRQQGARLRDHDRPLLELVLDEHRPRRKRGLGLQPVGEVVEIGSARIEYETCMEFNDGIEQPLNEHEREIRGADELVLQDDTNGIDRFIDEVTQVVVAIDPIIDKSIAIIVFAVTDFGGGYPLAHHHTGPAQCKSEDEQGKSQHHLPAAKECRSGNGCHKVERKEEKDNPLKRLVNENALARRHLRCQPEDFHPLDREGKVWRGGHSVILDKTSMKKFKLPKLF